MDAWFSAHHAARHAAHQDDLAIGARPRRLGQPALFVCEGGDATDTAGLNLALVPGLVSGLVLACFQRG